MTVSKYYFILILIVILFRCDTEYSKIEQLIQERVEEKSGSYILIVSGENVCEVCLNSIDKWLEDRSVIDTEIQFKGLYYKSSNRNSTVLREKIKTTESVIDWAKLDSPELLDEIVIKMSNTNGPYALFIESGKIRKIKCINKSSLKEILSS